MTRTKVIIVTATAIFTYIQERKNDGSFAIGKDSLQSLTLAEVFDILEAFPGFAASFEYNNCLKQYRFRYEIDLS